jgi:hypothetical protein
VGINEHDVGDMPLVSRHRRGLGGVMDTRTHSPECWGWHLECAKRRIQELKSGLQMIASGKCSDLRHAEVIASAYADDDLMLQLHDSDEAFKRGDLGVPLEELQAEARRRRAAQDAAPTPAAVRAPRCDSADCPVCRDRRE